MDRRGFEIVETIPEESENSHSHPTDSDQQNLEILDLFVEPGELKSFELPCITRGSKETSHRIYLSDKTTNFWFQFCYLEFRGFRVQDKPDEKLLLGEVLSPAKVVKQVRTVPKVERLQDKSLSTIPAVDNSDPISEIALPPDTKKLKLTHPFVLDQFMPNDENFLESDFKELEAFLAKSSGPQHYVKGVVEKVKNTNAAFASWKRGAKEEKCLPSLCLTLRLACHDLDNKEINEIVDLIVDVGVCSGIYYSTQIDRTENHPSLIYNVAVMMDCSPVLKKTIIIRLGSLMKILADENTDLFIIEKLVYENPEFLKMLILYLLCEPNRMDKKFYLALTFMEYYVQVAGDRCQHGLIVGDLLDLVNTKPSGSKLVDYYVKAYKSEDSFVSTTALARLSVIYQCEFQRSMLASPGDKALHKELYEQLWETHRHLVKVHRVEAMQFMLGHYLRCLCFMCKEKQLVTSYHRELDNLLMNRKIALEHAMEYFDFFCTMGERGDVLVCQFEVMRYLRYIEASLIALRYAVLNVDTLSYSKRYFMMAICKKEGLGSEPDLTFAFRVFKANYVELISKMSYSNTFETSICLSHIADILEKCEQPQAKDLRFFAVVFAVCSDEFFKMTKKFLYHFAIMLRKLAYFPTPGQDTPDETSNTEPEVIEIWKKGFYVPYSSNEDHVFHYLIERCIAENLYQFDSLKEVTKRLYDQSPERSIYLAQFTGITADSPAEQDQHHILTLKEVLSTVKDRITNGGKIQLAMEYIEAKVSPVVDECHTYFEQKFEKESSPDIGKQLAPNPVIRKVRMNLTILAAREKQAAFTDRSVERLIQSNLKDFGKVMYINNLEQSAISMVKKFKHIRLIHDSELDLNEDKPMLKFFHKAYVFNAFFTVNKQACKVFRIEIFDQARLNNFMENILWISTTTPSILNYFGIRFKAGKEALTVDIVSEDFEGFAWPNENMKIWTTQSIPLNTKFNMFEDLLMAVRSLHFIGKPHLTLTGGHMVVCKSSTRLKVIVPFFMEYFTDPTIFMRSVAMPDMAYISPKLLQATTFPNHDAQLFTDNLTEANAAFLNADIWSLAVVLVEILGGAAFGVGEHVGNYKLAVKKKSKVQDIVEFELKRVKKKFPDKRIPVPDLMAFFSNNHVERPGINRTIRFIGEFIKAEFNFNINFEKKLDKDYFLKSYFDCIDFFKDDDVDVLTLRGNEPIKLYLPTNLEYLGLIDQDYLPKGRGIIKRGRANLLEAEFEGGIPSNAITLSNRKGEQLNLHFKNGFSESCVFTSPLKEVESRDIHTTLHLNQLIPSREHLLAEFENFKAKKTFAEQLEDFKKGRPGKTDSALAGNVLDNLAQTLIGRHREGQRRSMRNKTVSKTMKQQLKDLGVSDSSSDDEAKKRENSPGKDAVFKGRERLQKFVHEQVEDRIDKMLIYRDIILDKREKRKKPDEDFETFVTRSKASIEVSDPFGYVYDILYNSHSDRIFYNKGKPI